jgi:hypothetical protein
MPKLGGEHRRILEMLARHHNGCTDDVLKVLGSREGIIDELLLAGLASAETRRVSAKPRVIKSGASRSRTPGGSRLNPNRLPTTPAGRWRPLQCDRWTGSESVQGPIEDGVI